MLAARYVPGNERLVLDRNYPIRELKDNEILLKVAASGVCHTDVAVLSGVLLDTRTWVMGHEASGIPVKYVCPTLAMGRTTCIIHRLGSKVDPQVVQKGKLYSILEADGCTHGINGGPALLNSLGLGKDGAYAEYVITTADTLVPVVSFKRLHPFFLNGFDCGIYSQMVSHRRWLPSPATRV
jgi:propanol-preferring alcohol dehydrogenase